MQSLDHAGFFLAAYDSSTAFRLFLAEVRGLNPNTRWPSERDSLLSRLL